MKWEYVSGVFFKDEKAPMITQDTVFVACMNVWFLSANFKKYVTHILKLSSPAASGGNISHSFCIQEQSFESVEIKGTGSLQQTFEVQLPRGEIKRYMEWCSVYVSLRDPWDWYLYIYMYIYRSMEESTNGWFFVLVYNFSMHFLGGNKK